MKNANFRTAGIVASVVVGLSALVWPDIDSLRGNALENCIIDVRPRRETQLPTISTEDLWEAQVYWMEWKAPTENKYGTEYAIEVPRDSLLLLGDGIGGNAVALEANLTYLVRVYWDNTAGSEGASYVVSGDDGTSWGTELSTLSKGAFDPVGKHQSPMGEAVHREDAVPEKSRIRFWSKNRGVEVAITLSDV